MKNYAGALALIVGAACGASSPSGPSSVDDAGTDAGSTVEPDAGGSNQMDAATEPSLVSLKVELTVDLPLTPSSTAAVIATGTMSDGAEIDLTLAATWHSTSSTTARVTAGGVLVASAPGRAEIWATRGPITSNRIEVTVEREGELRGVWVTRWTFSDTDDIDRIVDDAVRGHLNAIFFQVRGRADAYYASTLEPWAARLSGTLGRDPGWDPLAEAVARAHARGLQVHAWLNTFPAWSGATAPTESMPRHPLLAHPEWLCADDAGTPMPLGASGYQFFSPGNPDLRAHIAGVAEQIATNYDVDGIHFDYVRYPGRQYCHDAASEAQYDLAQIEDPDLTYAEFQRQRIALLLEDVRDRLAVSRPSVALTVASWGIHKNEWGWANVSRGYDDYYQAAHDWARRGIVDALCPMMYWRLTDPPGQRTDFAALAGDHVQATNEGGRFLYTGINAEHDADEVLAQVEAARAAGARGFVFFDLTKLREDGKLDRLAAGPFVQTVPPPRMRWK